MGNYMDFDTALTLAKEELVELHKELEQWQVSSAKAKLRILILLRLINHPEPTCDESKPLCNDPECMFCSVIHCPSMDPLHYHHDGCPSCYLENLNTSGATTGRFKSEEGANG